MKNSNINEGKRFNFLISIVIVLTIIVLGVYFGMMLFNNDTYASGKKDYDDLVNVDGSIYLGAYKNKIYYSVEEEIMYYSKDDKEEHLWLKTDETCHTDGFGRPCYSITEGKIIENTLYYHIASASVGDRANYILSIKLDSLNIDESITVVPLLVTSWEISEDDKIINGRGIDEDNFDITWSFEYNINSKELSKTIYSNTSN